jgi:pyruvate/2-oxoglutarate dehydrogenase complex dihydrolipoamide dehydrogenase (E3) component
MNRAQVDLCVIGAGSAGLSVAAAAALVGRKVVLIERGAMGGECLNTGCVPSKALLAAAKAVHGAREAQSFGLEVSSSVDFARVRDHVRGAIDAIAPHDSVERFEGMGVEVIRETARFIAARTVQVGKRQIQAHRVVIATGSEAAIPSIDGLADVPYLTNDTIFEIGEMPRHLVILGGGPIGMELGQAFRRLGAQVTVIERDKAMPKDDPELAQALLQRLADEGIAIKEHANVTKVGPEGDGISLTVEEAGQVSRLTGSHLLIATGRKARTSGLELEAAGIKHNDHGIVVDEHLKTSARGVYAAGDVTGGPKFTHVCSHHAGIVVQNALFRIPAKVDYRAMPWVTYTDPELAQVGMTEAQAREKFGDQVRVIRVPFAKNDRAQAEHKTEGLLKLVAHKNGRVVGASILGTNAGELAHWWVIAIQQGLKLRNLAQTFAPYPTWGELNKAAASEFSKPLLTGAFTRNAARIMSWFP